MALTDYFFDARPVNGKLLEEQLAALPVPVSNNNVSIDAAKLGGKIRVRVDTELTSQQLTTLTSVIQAHDGSYSYGNDAGPKSTQQQVEFDKATTRRQRITQLRAIKTKIDAGTILLPAEQAFFERAQAAQLVGD